MKKKFAVRLVLACATVLLCGTLAGCSGNSGKEGSGAGTEGTQTSQENPGSQVVLTKILAKDMDLDKYLVVKDYTNFRKEREEIIVDEAELQELMDTVYVNSFPAELGVKDRPVETGDTANIDYVGKKDGVAFDGGTAQDVRLTIGSGTYIPGFEEGLVGVMPGETVNLNLTFPAEYHNADLAGQAVVFTVTVNYIIPKEKMDEAVKGIVEEVNSVEELHQYVYDYLYSVAELQGEEDYEELILDAFLEEMCEFKELPQEWVDYYRSLINNNITSYALQNGVDPESLIQMQYGVSLDQFLTENSEIATRRELAMQIVARKEGYLINDDAELDKILLDIATQYGSDSVDAFLASNNLSRDQFREDYAYEMAVQHVIELAQTK